jgi:hypothetical protein
MPKYPAKTYEDINKDRIDVEFLRNKIKLKHLEAKKNFSEKYPYVEKFFREKGIDLAKIREHSAKLLGAGALTGALLLSPPTDGKTLPSPQEVVKALKERAEASPITQKLLVDSLAGILPEKTRSLTREEEKYLEQVFENVIGVKTKATLEGEHLNTTYGLIGAEQHLRRYPGDTLEQHGTGDVIKEGIAPGLGGWGYFAKSKNDLNERLEDTERWYAVVQTLYLPDWETRLSYLINWYKYRKVLIVNTVNGNAVVAAIADSGPAAWTGKHFGGSPEVMEYLGGKNYKKGPVVIFFVDDPENKVPLGPVDYNKINLSQSALIEI